MINREDLAQEIQAPVKSIRLFAIEKILSEGDSREDLQLLDSRVSEEDDEECRLLISHAIFSVRLKLEGKPGSREQTTTEADFRSRFEAGDMGKKFELLSTLTPETTEKCSQTAPEFLKKETNPLLCAQIIKTFSKVWPSGQMEMLTSRLFSESLLTRFAALEALIHHFPQFLEKYLPDLLVLPEPRTRVLAIRGLAKIDMDEALSYLENLLLSSDESERFMALQNCFFLPFEVIKPLLLKYVAAENNLEMLAKFGWLFESNPDPQVPYQLWEIAERATSAKAKTLKTSISGACKAIEDSGILGDQYASYQDRLQKWIYKRVATRFVQNCIDHFSILEDAKDLEFEILIGKKIQEPLIRSAFEEALGWPVEEKYKARIRAFLAIPGQPSIQSSTMGEGGAKHVGSLEGGALQVGRPAEARELNDGARQESQLPSPPLRKPGESVMGTPPEPTKAPDFSEASPEDRIRIMTLWEEKDLPLVKAHIANCIRNKDVSPDLRACAFRAALRFEIEEFVSDSEKWLKHADPNLSTAALQYLAHFDADRTFLQLGYFLKINNKRVKTVALKIMKRFDSSQALSAISAMLNHSDTGTQGMAISCMFHFDFPLVRDQLVSFLISHPESNYFDTGLTLFQSNPDPENLYPLFRLEKAVPSHKVETVRAARQDTEKLLEELGVLGKEDLQKSLSLFEGKWGKEQEKKAAPKPAYAFRKAEPKMEPGAEEKSALSFLKSFWGKNFLLISIVGFLGIGSAVFFIDWGSAQQSAVPRIIYESKQTPLTFVGEVKELDTVTGGVYLKDQDGNDYILFPKDDGFFIPKVGDRIRASIMSFEKNSRGLKRGLTKAFEKL